METEDKKPIKHEQPAASPRLNVKYGNRRVVLLAAGAVLLIIGFGIGWLSNINLHRHETTITRPLGGELMMRGERGGGDMNPTDGTAYTRLTGVVTQVSGNTITIAGNGTTKIVTTTSSTTYSPSSQKPAVNDSIIALGSDSNGTFTAITVHILNR